MQNAALLGTPADLPAGGAAFFTTTRDGVRVRGASWRAPDPRGTVLILQGRTEYIEKYDHVIRTLLEMGWNVAALDWRGQGLSQRPDNSTALGDVADFADYQSDLDAFVAHDAVACLKGPRILLCHSMGGAIGLRALQERFDAAGAIFSAPMWQLGLGPLGRWCAGVITGTACAMGYATAHAPFTNGAASYVANTPFADNLLTSHEPGYARLQQMQDAHPGIGLGGPSMRWVQMALSEGPRLTARPAVAQPTLTFVGSREQVVDPDAIRAYHTKPGTGRLFVIKGARHEVLIEQPEIRAQVWARIAEFLETF